MALILRQPNPESLILRRGLAARLSSLIWFGTAGIIMFKWENLIWLTSPCLLIGIHLLTYSMQIRIRRSNRDILWRQRILFFFAKERLLPFAGIRSVRIGARRTFFKGWHLYFFLVDSSKLSINHSHLSNRIAAQGDGLARFLKKPLVYEQRDESWNEKRR